MKLKLVLLFLLLSPCAWADNIGWLDFVAVPEIPEDGYLRHVQVLSTSGSTITVDGVQQTYAMSQHAVRLSAKEASALSRKLLAWADGAEAPGHMVWKQLQQDTAGTDRSQFWLEVTWQHDVEGRYLIVAATGLAVLRTGHYYPGSEDALTFQKATMRLSEDEGRALADGLSAWARGWNPEDAIIWSKLVEGPEQ